MAQSSNRMNPVCRTLDSTETISRAKEMVLEGKYEEALLLCEQALSADPENPDLWNGRGSALRSMGRYEEAAACFNRALEIDPRDRAAS